MPRNKVFSKGLAIGIIVLFIGVNLVPSITGFQKNLFTDSKNDRYNIIKKQNIEDIYQINQGERWALLIYICDKFADQPKSMKTVLCDNGWQEDHIKILVGDNINAKDIINNLFWLAAHSSIDDTVLIYLGADGNYGRFVLQDGKYMYYWRLNMEINKIKAQGMTIIIDSCRSGSAIPFLKKKNRVIITACKSNELTVEYDERFNIALQGFSDYEGNNDNLVSAEELFKYTLEDGIGMGNPQIQDDYPGELIITSVNLTFVDKENIDVYHNHPYKGDWFVFNNQFIAQSFKPFDNKITKIKLLLRHKSTDDPLIVSIRKNLDGNDLVSKIIPADTFSDCEKSVHRFFEIDLPDIIVNPNDTYYIVCKCNSKQSYRLGRNNLDKGDYYEGQLYYSSGGGFWYPLKNSDLIFIVYGEDINNMLPNKPDKPSGPTIIKPGTYYNYSTSTIDPNGDQVYYKWDWDNGNKSDWLGPFNSSETVYANNYWSEKGRYEIKVKARDAHGVVSYWSDPLPVAMMKNKIVTSSLFLDLVEKFLILERLLLMLQV